MRLTVQILQILMYQNVHYHDTRITTQYMYKIYTVCAD